MNYFYVLTDELEIWRSYCRWVLLEVLDKVCPGSVIWKQATKPPIKMPFRKVENCNQVVKLGKDLKFSLVNVAGNDIVQGNKKLILGNYNIFLLFVYLQLLLICSFDLETGCCRAVFIVCLIHWLLVERLIDCTCELNIFERRTKRIGSFSRWTCLKQRTYLNRLVLTNIVKRG